MADKKKLMIVGGIFKNIPKKVKELYEVEHIPEHLHFKREITGNPDVVIINKDYISHKQFADAKNFAVSNSIPLLVETGGWSSVIRQAGERGITWLINDPQEIVEDDELPEDLEDIVHNAWRSAYERQHEENKALERRLRKDRNKLEIVLKRVDFLEKQGNAAERVIHEVREAAKLKQQEKAWLEKRQTEILGIIEKLNILDEIKVQLKKLLDN